MISPCVRAALAAFAGLFLFTASSHAAEPQKIAVIPKGTTHVFWKAVEAGARDAATELGVEAVWKGPLKENDRAQQISIVEQFTGERVAGIVLAPLDDIALRRPVAAATARRIPVVIMDSALQGEAGKDFVTLVSTDNRAAGRLAAEELARTLGGKGNVVLLRYLAGSASTQEREDGFMEAATAAGLTITLSNRHAGATASDAKATSLNLMDKLREADAVFCPNESTTFGMLLALRQGGLIGKVKLIGFDTSPPLVEGLRKGEISALVAQNPRKMGYEAVSALVKKLKGEPVPPFIDTGATVLTKASLDKPETRKLLGE